MIKNMEDFNHDSYCAECTEIELSIIELQHYYGIMRELNIDLPIREKIFCQYTYYNPNKKSFKYYDRNIVYFEIYHTVDKIEYRYFHNQNIIATMTEYLKENFKIKKLLLNNKIETYLIDI